MAIALSGATTTMCAKGAAALGTAAGSDSTTMAFGSNGAGITAMDDGNIIGNMGTKATIVATGIKGTATAYGMAMGTSAVGFTGTSMAVCGKGATAMGTATAPSTAMGCADDGAGITAMGDGANIMGKVGTKAIAVATGTKTLGAAYGMIIGGPTFDLMGSSTAVGGNGAAAVESGTTPTNGIACADDGGGITTMGDGNIMGKVGGNGTAVAIGYGKVAGGFIMAIGWFRY